MLRHQSFTLLFVAASLGCRSAPSLRLELTPGVQMEFVQIPAGSFSMGSPAAEPDHVPSEAPLHVVQVLKPFWFARFEVTQRQWNAVWGNASAGSDGFFPVAGVNYDDALRFAGEMSRKTGRTVRLPTEAEWEYVCRAGTKTPFYFGSRLTRRHSSFNAAKTRAQSNAAYRIRLKTDVPQPPVGSFPPNAFGVYDMHGGVWEWTLDTWHSDYSGAPPTATAWMNGGTDGMHVVRGGAWDTAMHRQRCAYRDGHGHDERYGNLGIRMVVE
jgi:formylglycine-generating enzyme required for sulfatase activity